MKQGVIILAFIFLAAWFPFPASAVFGIDIPKVTIPAIELPSPTPTPGFIKGQLHLPLEVLPTNTPSPSPSPTPNITSTITPAVPTGTESGTPEASLPAEPSGSTSSPTSTAPPATNAFRTQDYVTWGLLITLALILLIPKFQNKQEQPPKKDE